MNTSTCLGREQAGFTLLELLVVIGILGAFVGALGWSARGTDRPGMALRSAQSQVAALLEAARTHAVRHQVSTRLLVQATPPPAGEAAHYLRRLQIAAEVEAGSEQWIAVEEPLLLPATVRVVPPAMPPTHLAAGVAWPADPLAPLSQLTEQASFVLDGEECGRVYSLGFAPDGQRLGDAGTLVLGVVQPSPYSFPRFSNPAAARRIAVRPSGVLDVSEDAHDE